MAHKLIVGQTLSGKSTLAHAIEHDAVSRNIQSVIYDPTLSDKWKSQNVTADEHEFFEMLILAHETERPTLVTIDEADTLLSMAHRQYWWLFTRGRHFRFECMAITQRPKLVAPSVRGNAPELFVFQTGKSDALDLAADYGAEGIAAAPDLKQGEFLSARWINGVKTVTKNRIF